MSITQAMTCVTQSVDRIQKTCVFTLHRCYIDVAIRMQYVWYEFHYHLRHWYILSYFIKIIVHVEIWDFWIHQRRHSKWRFCLTCPSSGLHHLSSSNHSRSEGSYDERRMKLLNSAIYLIYFQGKLSCMGWTGNESLRMLVLVIISTGPSYNSIMMGWWF